MGTKDPGVDAYIANAAPFARPILTRLREIVHEACPGTEESLKWSSPHFGYKGMLCNMAAFNEHCAFGFWKGRLIVRAEGSKDAMGDFGRLTKLSDLPPKKELVGYIRKAMAFNDAPVKEPRPVKHPKPALAVPADLEAALKKNKKARATFDAFPAGQKREYVEWLTDAKREETRAKRLADAVAWMAEGKRRNWKYENC